MPTIVVAVNRRAGATYWLQNNGVEPPSRCCLLRARCCPIGRRDARVAPNRRGNQVAAPAIRGRPYASSKRLASWAAVGHAGGVHAAKGPRRSCSLPLAPSPDRCFCAASQPNVWEINPRMGTRISSKKAVSPRPRLTLDRSVWLTIRAPLNVRRGGAKGGDGASDSRMCDHFGPNARTRVNFQVRFGDFDAFSHREGREGRGRVLLLVPTDEPDQGTCRTMLGAQRSARWLDLCALRVALKSTQIGRSAQNANLYARPRASCELCGWGAGAPGYGLERERKGMAGKGHSREQHAAFEHPDFGHTRGRRYRSRLEAVAEAAGGLRASRLSRRSLGTYAPRRHTTKKRHLAPSG